MKIAPALINALRYMDDDQKAIVAHKQGPLLVIAGPGSGKTHSLIHLAVNLFLCEDADPSQVVLCTYTEKAAYELQDRLAAVATDINYTGDLSRLKIGTIHGVCQQIVNEHLSDTSLVDGYETLTQFTQQLFILEHLNTLCSDDTLAFFHKRWGTPWAVAKNLAIHFNTITEELIFEKLCEYFPTLNPSSTWQTILYYSLTCAYDQYRRVLRKTNCTDFARLQKWAYNLLKQPDTFQKITKNIRYVLVDEYQDTNYIQEKILTLLASHSNNLIVIGDEDQALYRFRGATVRNILTFEKKFPGCSKVQLTINRRSHPGIIEASNRWMTTFDWSNPEGNSLRTAKTMRAIPDARYKDYPSTVTLNAVAVQDEAEQFAEMVATLKQQGKIDDYSDVALLLHSVRSYMSDSYIQALARRKIPAYCPRAGTFFAQIEVGLILGCFARIFQYPIVSRPQAGSFAEYLQACFEQLQEQCQKRPELERELQAIEKEIAMASGDGEALQNQSSKHIFEYDLRRLYYVAFSRAKGLLVLTAAKKRQDYRFNTLWQSVPSWASLQKNLIDIPKLRREREYMPPKPRYGFTTHVQTYLTCPRRYEFFYEHRFAPSRSQDGFFGQLVHQTIERIHHQALNGAADSLNEQQIRAIFEKTYYYWDIAQKRSMNVEEKEKAFHQVSNYFQQNQREMQHIQAAELGIQIDREDYILKGKIDLLRNGKRGLEVIDFKTHSRPRQDTIQLRVYQQQLSLYAYAFHQHTGQYPSRLWLYWTGEARKEDALMEVPWKERIIS